MYKVNLFKGEKLPRNFSCQNSGISTISSEFTLTVMHLAILRFIDVMTSFMNASINSFFDVQGSCKVPFSDSPITFVVSKQRHINIFSQKFFRMTI